MVPAKNDENQNDIKNVSKAFGKISPKSDHYIERILTGLTQLDIYNDDNGRELIIKALGSCQTFFFDIDLLNVEKRTVIEFLKNDSIKKKEAGEQQWSLTNVKAHPNRYWAKNKQNLLIYGM